MKKIITFLCSLLLLISAGVQKAEADTEYKVYYKLEYDSQGIYTLYISGTDNGGYTEDLKKGIYNSAEEVPWHDVAANIAGVFVGPCRPSKTSYWFAGLSNVTNINLNNLNTTDVEDMSHMFENCKSLTSLEFKTSQITNNVTNMASMFEGCSSLETIQVSSNFSIASVTTSGNMFYGCTSLVGGNGTKYDANKVDATYARYDQPDSCSPGYFTKYYKLKYDAGEGGVVSPTCKDVDGGSSIGALPVPTQTGYYFVGWVDSIGNIIDSSYKMPNSNTTIYAKWIDIYWGIENKQLHLSSSESNIAKNPTNGIYNNANEVPWASSASDISKVIIEDEITPVQMAYWFAGLSNVTEIVGIDKLDTSNVTNMSNMFEDCKALQDIDLSSFDTSKVKNMSSLFEDCSSLNSLNIYNFKTSAVTNFDKMFKGCSNLTSIDVTGSYFNTSANTSAEDMFLDCTNLVGENGTSYSTSGIGIGYAKVDEGAAKPGYFSEVLYYWGIDSNELHISKSKGNIATNLTSGIYSNVNEVPWASSAANINKVIIEDEIAPVQTAYWFSGLSNVENIDLGNLNNNKNTNMSHMLDGCSSLQSINFSDTISKNLIDVSYMFYDCGALTTLDLSMLNTEKVTDMSFMFYNCSSLLDLNIRNFVTDKVNTMESMFQNCTSLTFLDLSIFTSTNLSTMTSMFDGCNKLVTIYADPDFSGVDVHNKAYAFSGCTSLVGGDGTKYNSSYDDGYFARIDEKGTRPGYFTKVPTVADFTFVDPAGVYDGKEKAASFIETVANMVIKYSNSLTGTWTKDAPKDAGTYYVQVSIEPSANYTVTSLTDENWKFTVSPRSLSVIGSSADGKVYDGDTSAVAYVGNVSGKVNGDDVSVEIDTANFVDKNAGNGKEVTITYKISGEDASNYTKPTDSSTVADIEKAKVAVPVAQSGLIYNGSSQIGMPSFTGAKYAISGSNTATNAGDYTIVATLIDKDNYVWDVTTPTSEDQTISWSIAKKEIEVTADDQSSAFGSDLVSLTYTVNENTTLCDGDFFSGALTTTANKDIAGAYDIEQGTLTAGDNYTITFTKGTYTVNPKVNSNKSNVKVDGNVLSISFTKGNAKDIVIDIKGTYSIDCKAALYQEDTKVLDCDCSSGSIKVTIPGNFVKTLAAGEHEYTLKVTNDSGLSYNYDLNISIDNPSSSNSTYSIVKTGVEG